MKGFILDSTYKDATIINTNDDIFTVSINNLPSHSISHHSINLTDTNLNHSNKHTSSDKFNSYNFIDYL